jgi:hypothetical protein
MSQMLFPFAQAARAKAFVRATSTKLHSDILELLGKHRDLNRQEIADLLGKGIQSVCGPVLELLRSGQLVETGGYRKTRYGGDASLVSLPPKKPTKKRGGK